MANPPSIKGV
ncbi:e13b8860-b95a-46e5-89c8-585a3ae05617 [Thermothielavioides terrestris]|uniref:E13b8860-b95a-46e5-89c8-585a3ae05617 n=1 Tax=Thermothielavioides terrestris TaxID=2587410 RepID=A0A3S4AQK9_9PEZI|nr:e13b8860-b95a-46e5-89c8-585a3ae05617 [Thermothielavioides terrestris]